MKHLKPKIFILFVLLTVIFSCAEDDKPAPDLPAYENIRPDLSYFSAPGDSASNYEAARNTVLMWKTLFEDSLKTYGDLYESLSQNELEYQDNNTWLISKKIFSEEKTYDIKYFEIAESDSVLTKMFVSLFIDNDTVYNELLLIDGYFFPDSSTGFWLINKPDTSNTVLKYLNIEQDVKSETEKTLKITTLLIDENNGNYIIYKDSVDGQYNKYLDIFEKATENHTIIQYASSDITGRIKDLRYFGDSEWHCWNEERVDENCSAKIISRRNFRE
ncbi:MAG: hypothetical protein GXO50_03465 [Chlorobi bacterium]|nr:hypothetical protein [Chlorobiota bacterium]